MRLAVRINDGTKSAEANVLLYSSDREFVHNGEKKISKAFSHSDSTNGNRIGKE